MPVQCHNLLGVLNRIKPLLLLLVTPELLLLWKVQYIVLRTRPVVFCLYVNPLELSGHGHKMWSELYLSHKYRTIQCAYSNNKQIILKVCIFIKHTLNIHIAATKCTWTLGLVQTSFGSNNLKCAFPVGQTCTMLRRTVVGLSCLIEVLELGSIFRMSGLSSQCEWFSWERHSHWLGHYKRQIFFV